MRARGVKSSAGSSAEQQQAPAATGHCLQRCQPAESHPPGLGLPVAARCSRRRRCSAAAASAPLPSCAGSSPAGGGWMGGCSREQRRIAGSGGDGGSGGSAHVARQSTAAQCGAECLTRAGAQQAAEDRHAAHVLQVDKVGPPAWISGFRNRVGLEIGRVESRSKGRVCRARSPQATYSLPGQRSAAQRRPPHTCPGFHSWPSSRPQARAPAPPPAEVHGQRLSHTLHRSAHCRPTHAARSCVQDHAWHPQAPTSVLHPPTWISCTV